MRWKTIAIVCLGLAALSVGARAATFDVDVTRLSPNLYRIDGQQYLIVTRSCFEFKFGERAILDSAGSGGAIFFPSSKTTCDVRGVYTKAQVGAGSYSVTATHEIDDWYSLDNDLFILTESCFAYKYYSKAAVTLQGSGFGFIAFFDDRTNCSVRGVYRRARL